MGRGRAARAEAGRPPPEPVPAQAGTGACSGEAGAPGASPRWRGVVGAAGRRLGSQREPTNYSRVPTGFGEGPSFTGRLEPEAGSLSGRAPLDPSVPLSRYARHALLLQLVP